MVLKRPKAPFQAEHPLSEQCLKAPNGICKRWIMLSVLDSYCLSGYVRLSGRKQSYCWHIIVQTMKHKNEFYGSGSRQHWSYIYYRWSFLLCTTRAIKKCYEGLEHAHLSQSICVCRAVNKGGANILFISCLRSGLLYDEKMKNNSRDVLHMLRKRANFLTWYE